MTDPNSKSSPPAQACTCTRWKGGGGERRKKINKLNIIDNNKLKLALRYYFFCLKLALHSSYSGFLYGYTIYQFLIHEWTKILGSAPHPIVYQAEYYHRPRHEYAIVHRFRLHWSCGRPETPEDDEDDVGASERVVDCAPNAADPPWSPYQSWLDDIIIYPAVVIVTFNVFGGRGFVKIHGSEFRSFNHLAGGTAPEEEDARDEVRCIETGDREGDDVVIYRGGANSDESKKARDQCDDDDRHHGNWCTGLNLNWQYKYDEKSGLR